MIGLYVRLAATRPVGMALNTFAASGGCGLLKRNDSLCQGESVAFTNKGGAGYHRPKSPTRITLKCTGYITIQSPEPDHPLTVHEVKETYYLCTPKEPKIPAPTLNQTLPLMQGPYKIITLCGSTRFKDQFIEAQKRLTLEGNIVISVGLFGHSGDKEVWTEGTKEMLDDMHKRKIDMADEIFVINVGGYIGSSTRSEIEYAKSTGKAVRYLEEPDVHSGIAR